MDDSWSADAPIAHFFKERSPLSLNLEILFVFDVKILLPSFVGLSSSSGNSVAKFSSDEIFANDKAL